jgi:hypothetical protein
MLSKHISCRAAFAQCQKLSRQCTALVSTLRITQDKTGILGSYVAANVMKSRLRNKKFGAISVWVWCVVRVTIFIHLARSARVFQDHAPQSNHQKIKGHIAG